MSTNTREREALVATALKEIRREEPHGRADDELISVYLSAKVWCAVADAITAQREAPVGEAVGNGRLYLGARIMNLQCAPKRKTIDVAAGDADLSYKLGHRDARHAAAELADAVLAAEKATTLNLCKPGGKTL